MSRRAMSIFSSRETRTEPTPAEGWVKWAETPYDADAEEWEDSFQRKGIPTMVLCKPGFDEVSNKKCNFFHVYIAKRLIVEAKNVNISS